MKKIAFLAVCVGALGLLACGGGSSGDDDDDTTNPDGSISFVDSGTTIDATVTAECNPVAQTGCDPGDKCTWIVESADPYLAYTGCTTDGDKDLNEACTSPDTGADDCMAGYYCLSGTCAEICNTAAMRAQGSCPDGYACGTYNQLFEDMGDGAVGICDFLCDPVQQDCPMEGKACYLNGIEGESTCSPLIVDDTFTQGQDCYDLEGVGHCWLNGCSKGFGAFLVPTDTCAFYCTPYNNYKDDHPYLSGDPTNGGIPCEATFDDRPNGPGVSYQCRFVQAYWSNYTETPDTVGMCVDPTSDYGADRAGSCADFDLNQLITDYNNGTTIDATYCGTNPDNCLFDCVSNEFLDSYTPTFRAKYGAFMTQWVRQMYAKKATR